MQGYTEDSVADVRQRLNVHLYGEPAADLTIPADELALRRSLGVA